MPEPRYFSMPSAVFGAVAFRKSARNCTPCVRSLTQFPVACTNSPAEIVAAWPTTVTSSLRPRTRTRSTQKPFSALWNVTRSTRPARASVEEPSGGFAANVVERLISDQRQVRCRHRPDPSRRSIRAMLSGFGPPARTYGYDTLYGTRHAPAHPERLASLTGLSALPRLTARAATNW